MDKKQKKRLKKKILWWLTIAALATEIVANIVAIFK